MILECIATGLLACGIAFNSSYVNNDNHYVSSDNHISESISPNYVSNSINRVSGLYNFKDEVNFYNFFNNKPVDYYHYFDVFFDEDKLGICPISLGNQALEFLNNLSIEVQAGAINTILIDFLTYDTSDVEHEYILNVDEISSLQDLDYPYLFFNFSSSLILSNEDYEIFNLIFTHDDNEYIVSYSGYYNFLNNALISNTDFSNIIGSIVYNNSLTFAMGFYAENSQSVNWVETLSYDVTTNRNGMTYYSFTQVRNTPNIFFNGVKMSVDVYNTLYNVGVFSYIRDTSLDNTTFHDLLFTLMDVPVYFITRFFNFELFGMNLAVAFAGLVTLAVMLFVIRIIWRLN